MKRILLISAFLFGCEQKPIVFTVHDAIIAGPLASRTICFFSSGKDLGDLGLARFAVLSTYNNVSDDKLTDSKVLYRDLSGADLFLAQTLNQSMEWVISNLTEPYTDKDTKVIMLSTLNGCLEGLDAKISSIEGKKNESN